MQLICDGEGGGRRPTLDGPIDRDGRSSSARATSSASSARAIVKTEPRNWITNFEPTTSPYVEFYDEDFPWRYTPARPDAGAHRLRPWIALVVLEEGEFDERRNVTGQAAAVHRR